MGRLLDWVLSPPSASTPGLAAAGPATISERRGGLMINLSRTDVASSEEGLRHLYDRRNVWVGRGYHLALLPPVGTQSPPTSSNCNTSNFARYGNRVSANCNSRCYVRLLCRQNRLRISPKLAHGVN